MNKEKCVRCGYSEFKGALQIHHLDGNHLNNVENNMIVLCSNCHVGVHYHLWKLETIGIKTPDFVKEGKGRRFINKTPAQICEDIAKEIKPSDISKRQILNDLETMRTELNKVQLMIPNKESKIL